MNLSLLLIPAFVTVAAAATIPAGTELQARLTNEVSSSNPSGSAVSAVVVVPVFVNGAPVLLAGTRLIGNTADASAFRPASDGATEQPATLRLQFTRIAEAVGQPKPLFSVVTGVDNAREAVDNTGLITGIAQSQTLEAQIDKGISKVASQYGQFAQILSGLKGALVKQVDPSINYKPGVDVTLRLTKPLSWTAPITTGLPAAILPADVLVSLVNREPFRTVAQNPPEPSDMTNLIFIGTAQEIQGAFHEAGWSQSDVLSGSSKMETARALIEDRGYKEAPMSILFLDGRPPDFTMQKQNDTFAMRHHIRIWQRPELFNGKPVWVAAATHDISITFSAANRSFIHRIDSNIDAERAKVVNDLLFTGRVRGVALVDRTGLPSEASNATGDKLTTDGRIAAVDF